MATVYLLVGLPGSGKTELAKRIANERGAVRFSLDEWVKGLCDWSIDSPQYGPLAARVKERIWQTGLDFLKRNIDIVLDWSLWSRELRREWTSRIQGHGHVYKLFFLDPEAEVREKQLENRNRNAPSGCHQISIEEVRRFSKIFEPPDINEGIEFETL